jgi:hypothetical protein
MKSRRLIASLEAQQRLTLANKTILADVSFGSLADICDAKSNVRFTPESGH